MLDHIDLMEAELLEVTERHDVLNIENGYYIGALAEAENEIAMLRAEVRKLQTEVQHWFKQYVLTDRKVDSLEERLTKAKEILSMVDLTLEDD